MGNLNSMFVLMVAYLYTDFLYIYYYDRILGMRYSLKFTVLVTFSMWVCDCCMKLFPQYLWGMDQTGIINSIMLITTFLYAVLLYKGTLMRRLLVTGVYMVVQIAMDLIGMQLATIIVGERELFDTVYVIASTFCSGITITLGTVITVWIWRKTEVRKMKIDGYQWFSMLLPFSQFSLLQYIGMKYAGRLNGISVFIVHP